MKKLKTIFFAIFSFTFLQGEIQEELNDSVKDLVNRDIQFAFNLLRLNKEKEVNYVVSPFSTSTALGIILAGAKGITAEEMEKALKRTRNDYPTAGELTRFLLSDSQNSNGVVLKIANGIWIQKDYPILDAFLEVIRRSYAISLNEVDFLKNPNDGLKKINEWVSKETNNKIHQIINLQDIKKQTRLILTNAIFLKGEWKVFFPVKETRKEKFYSYGERFLDTMMMHLTETFFFYQDEEITLIEIPYKKKDVQGPEFALNILLPKKEVKLEKVLENLTLEKWKEWKAKGTLKKVALTFPKFRFEGKNEMRRPLERLGMRIPFTPEANFSGITKNPELYISQVVQKVFFEVDEVGTEAAAATLVEMGLKSIYNSEEAVELKVDHPFLFFLEEKQSGTLLFEGILFRP